MSWVQKVVKEETALFLVGFRETDPQAVEQWKKLCEETLSKLSAAETDWYWSARERYTIRMCIAELKQHQRQIDQRVANHNQCAQDNATCNQILLQAETAKAFHQKLFAETTEFIETEQGADWARRVATLLAQWRSIPLARQEKTARCEELSEILDTLSLWQGDITSRIHMHNGAVAKYRAEAAYALIGDVEGRRLDEQQLNCIVKKAHNHLVIAGAGTGKTTTVVGKIKYLLRSGQCRPEDILVLSFTNASAAEMSERIRNETGVPIQASTFHKLGVDIITKVRGKKPKIAQIDMQRFVLKELATQMCSDEYLGRLAGYVLYDNNNGEQDTTSVEPLQTKSAREMWRQASCDDKKILDGIAQLFATVINLMKSNNFTIDDIRRKNTENGNTRSINDILWLITPILNAYSEDLQTNGEIDFGDMITLATEYVSQGRFQNPYRVVIVDEYQDISKARYRLLKTMRESQDFDLFCVGDDWQSIYRFAGSDIGFILNFAQYWGPSEESKIETTYRFGQSLIDISSSFVMRNPAQKRKEIKSRTGETSFALSEVNAYSEKKAVEFLAQRLERLPANSTVFMIGRYAFDVNLLKACGMFEINCNNQAGLIEVAFTKRRDLKMHFVTAHKSKGLQADYVVILNNKHARMGFPSMIQDSPIMDLLLEKSDDYPHAEERRLFYVALTRARKHVILLTVRHHASVFAKELRQTYSVEISRASWLSNMCPMCGGKLKKRHSEYGPFWACENYGRTGCDYKRPIS